MKNLLITGGNGFIGSELSRLALAQNYKVISVSRRGKESNYRTVITFNLA